MSDLIDTTEMYLRTIYELIEDGVTPMRARIAEQLDHSGPTVSQTIARMERDGLVIVTADRHLELTEEGEQLAVRVMRKHRLAERLLLDVIGLDLPHVHEEACRWEHVMSDRVEKRLLEMLDETAVSPYGNPIPGLAEIGGENASAALSGEISVLDAISQGVSKVTLTRIGENPQAAEGFLDSVIGAGLVPGALVNAWLHDGRIVVSAGTEEVVLSETAAKHVFGTPDLAEHHK